MRHKQMEFELPELDKKRTQVVVEAVLEKYRMFKTITLEEREASTTASYSDMPRSYTGTTSDQTANIAIHNVDGAAVRREYCNKIDRAVKRLHPKERLLIEERYMKDDYVFDWMVYQQIFNPAISKDTYIKIRWKAFYRLAFILDDMHILQIESIVNGSS
ncbi:transcriptional regulator [Paenibacillus sp. 598K]|uniref:ArpU family phage packaging/lysis transcriptional regulator n=1 Tax=Paenibacillus sp. 598K TaxID=1117987 RepID=UPI000FF9E456|nr:ArpU family phage packaging/lysis transcriptional regulator [Paenibacillus sp. 598K]GBF73134.1 transcriptional regulator [Paenibacillus sp. 598K]